MSEPIWHDGLSKHMMMRTIRRVWLAKLALIHEIKFSYGAGSGKPGPVDDWNKGGPDEPGVGDDDQNVITSDETGSFGPHFDPTEWV